MNRNPLALGVNLDHVATLRQARKSVDPCPLEAMFACERAGCHIITVHLREDLRHIQKQDVLELKRHTRTLLNLEISLHPNCLDFALQVQPDSICLVPENRLEVTTESGLDLIAHCDAIEKFLARCPKSIRVFAFIDPIRAQVEAAKLYGLAGVELHTGDFAHAWPQKNAQGELLKIAEVARLAYSLNLQVNAGHGLNFYNVCPVAEIPEITELHIGHSIISRAVIVGLESAVRQMLALLQNALLTRRMLFPW